MIQGTFNRYIFFIMSFIPISFLIGPAISLINILIIDITFMFIIFYKSEWKWLKNKNIQIILLLYAYLIFNSFISLDFSNSLNRNFGFLRFIIFFAAINYFFNKNENFKKIFNIWLIIIIIVCCDIYLEKITGNNILGYGKDIYRGRIVSFFKDELIAGTYVAGFFLLLIGNLSINYKINNINFLIILLAIIIFSTIIITGERSTGIKSFLSVLIFFFIYFKQISFKKKLFFSLFFISLLFLIIVNSSYLKFRYYDQIEKQVKYLVNNISEKENLDEKYNNIYIELYKSGFLVFKRNPFFGVGNKNYRIESCANNQSNDYFCQTHPHQIYIEFLSEHGLIGTLILLSLIFLLLFKILKVILLSKNYLQLGCFLYLLFTFTPLIPGGSFFTDFNSSLFWINLSIMYALNPNTNIFSNVK